MKWTRIEEPSYQQIVMTKVPGCEHCPMYDQNVRVKPQDMTKAPGFRGQWYNAPDVLVVGEAPGLGDRATPFSGPAGIFIRDTLHAARLVQRSYLTNLVKCRPFVVNAKGRREAKEPTQEIVKHCGKQLAHDIYQVGPKVILTLGQAAFAWFVPKRSARGAMGRKFNSRFGIPVVPITNPAAILRTGDRVDYERIRLVLANLWDIVDGIPITKELPDAILVQPPATCAALGVSEKSLFEVYHRRSADVGADATLPLHWRDTEIISWESAKEIIEDATEIVGDIEATGLDPYAPDADILSFSFSIDDQKGYVFPVWYPGFRGVMRREAIYHAFFEFIRLCVSKGLWFHNADYDMKYIAVMYFLIFGEEWVWERPVRCTLILHWLIEALSSHDLEALVSSFGYVNHKRILEGHRRVKEAGFKDRIDKARKDKDVDALAEAKDLMASYKRMPFAFVDWYLLSRYNAADTALTWHVRAQLLKQLAQHPMLQEILEMHWDYLLTAHRMQISGLTPNPPAIEVARAKQVRRIVREGMHLYYDPCFLQLLIEEYGYPVEDRVPFTPASMERHFKFTSGKNMSRLLFGKHTAKNEETSEQEIVESPCLGLPTTMSERNNNGYAVNNNVLKAMKGADWDVFSVQHPWSEVNPETGERDLGGLQLLKAYRKMLARGRTKTDALEKLRAISTRSVGAHVIEFKNAKKYLSTYIDGIGKRTCPDGQVRDQMKVHGTITGRWASFLHTIPRDDKTLKNQFCSRYGDDGIIISADQSQAEARVFASFSGDEKLLAIFHERRDLHTEVAAAFHGIPIEEVTEDQRNKGKTIHFATVYGMSVDTLAVKLTQRGLTFEEAIKYAERFVDWYFSNFKTLARWIDRLMDELRVTGYSIASTQQNRWWRPRFKARDIQKYVVSPFGRELLIPMNCSKSDLRRYCANYPTQSAAGDITNKAAVRVDQELKKAGCDARLILTVHDSVVIDSPREEMDAVAAIVAREMMRTEEYKEWLRCDLETDVIVGPSLGNLIDIDKWREAHAA